MFKSNEKDLAGCQTEVNTEAAQVNSIYSSILRMMCDTSLFERCHHRQPPSQLSSTFVFTECLLVMNVEPESRLDVNSDTTAAQIGIEQLGFYEIRVQIIP